ncbi:chain-length determining protein [Vibrio vulnificus]|uniref:GumC family protein n=1 Tax=Vibrio TaxID=662 RepID=UPI0005032B9E|nr:MULTISPECIES: GNVR domain-containing protein [Vibrio]ASJ38673.1 chain-length determining protein [Vibrio vulnificus]EGQ7938531.1 chain-length determining protein [Vibrio vulnificus]EGQ8027347.1 chain-length determining protein [Vibrio vulnificus]EGQ8091511.1 chain-length determining protein [Vibrio vulnificus]EGQ9278265.1 chain-length determining protein [Vibrio vulnificus]
MMGLKLRLYSILVAAWRRRYVIVTPIVILPIVGALIGMTATPIYRSHTSMLIQETAKMNPFLEDIAVSTMLKDRLSALSTLLKSRHVLYSVAKQEGLIDDNMTTAEQDRLIHQLAGKLNVQQLGKDFIQIELVANSPKGMASLLSAVSDQFIDQLLAPERSSIRDSSEFLTVHIEKRQQELFAAEQALADFQNQYSADTPAMQAQNLTRLASLKQSLAEKEAELAGVEKTLGSLDQQLSKTNPVIGKIEEQIITIRSELALLSAKYTEQHSSVQAKMRELSRLEQERHQLLSNRSVTLNSAQLWDIASSTISDPSDSQPLLVTQLQQLQAIRGRYEALNEETLSLANMIGELEQKANHFGNTAKDITRLERDVTVKRQLYEELVQRYEMAQLTGSLGIFEQNKRVKVIDVPYTPSSTANLPVILFVLAGLFGGIALGAGMAIFFEIFDSTIRSQQQLRSLINVPVLTVIPRIRAPRN